MDRINASKVLIGATFAAVFALATTASASGQDVHSYCLRGGGSVIPQMRFRNYRAVPESGRGVRRVRSKRKPPDPAFARISAKMIRPVHAAGTAVA